MKLYKLYTHQKNFSSEDLLLNAKEHPDAKIDDVVEIYLPEDEGCRLLLQIKSFREDLKETISIESNIALTFNFRTYADVIVRVVNPASVALDSVEITFKDQYMGRSEMWRLKKNLTNTCVYINKKIEYCEGSIRCQVYEMWSQGDRVACGVITEDTKVVFRSSTSMVYLFIQMSSEMWDFDIYGDLYFEKAVNGFLADLFMKWKKLGSNHEVTIVMFSRTFYGAKSLDEFPPYMRDCLQMDYKGRYYEDFYRVAIQNERNDDWSTILVQLRRLFTAYQGIVLRYHERPGFSIPAAMNSTAAQGNFLEVLNISLNVFEKHYLDRSFDRTGQLSVVITPGVGVFEVDRELTNITKQRIIDNGVGSDLVCVGEQPLHAVPLLKFHNKDPSLSAIDDYSMPHWINLSFYSTNKKVAYSTFIPRIKLPPLISQTTNGENKENHKLTFLTDNQTEYIHNSLFDYDAYDAQIFQLPLAHGTCSLQRVPRTKKTSVPSIDGFGMNLSREWESLTPPKPIVRRKMSDPDIHHGSQNVLTSISQNNSPNLSESHLSSSINTSNIMNCNNNNNLNNSLTNNTSRENKRKLIISNSPIIRPGRALINPFDPSHVTIKLTSNRRRWTHIFPKGPTGVLIQQHHYQAVPTTNGVVTTGYQDLLDSADYMHTSTCEVGKFDQYANNYHYDYGISDDILKEVRRKAAGLHSAAGPSVTVAPSKSLTLLWGATGEQEWTPALTTGVDWKSLTIPACLPITTDYFPDKRSLHNDYVVSDYNLLPEDVNADYAQNRAVYRKPLTTEEVFKELVSQRLAQGFQLIVLPDNSPASPPQAPCCGGQLQQQHHHQHQQQQQQQHHQQNHQQQHQQIQQKEPQSSVLRIVPSKTKEYLLSIGRIFHKISLCGSGITVTRYRPRHPYPPINVDYRYRFQAPQHDTYEVSGVNFTTEKLENFNWNFMDFYICTRGDTDYPLLENLKYWRYRMYLLPKEHPAMKRILDGTTNRCDIYTQYDNNFTLEYYYKQQIDEFLRFIEIHLNKIKRVPCKKLRVSGSPTAQQSHLTRRRHSTSILTRPPPNQGLGNSPFRERLGSNRLPEKPRPRSGSKVEKGPGCVSPAAEATGLALNTEERYEETDDGFVTGEQKLKSTATILEIFEALKHPQTGVGFLSSAQSLPSYTFVSYDAINWLHQHMESPCDPIKILEAMRLEKFICHASGDFSKPIISGFYLYFIVLHDRDSKDVTPLLRDLEAFENEWMEVEICNPDGNVVDELEVAKFLRDKVDMPCLDGRLYKQTHLEVDLAKKSDRVEWGHARYHQTMTPGHAFELVVQWVTASGPIVYDLAYGWCRKAQQCGFQFVTIPSDPLAEPFTEKSDPLRGPIYIPLELDCLKQHRSYLFEEFKKETWSDRLLLFQEKIVAQFGFMPCAVETKTGSNQISLDHQYVHCSGNMFILALSSHQGSRTRQRLTSSTYKKPSLLINRYANIESQTQSNESFITRHVSGKNKDDCDVVRKTGFLWSWNHMIANKKWKSLVINNSPDGEIFQLKMLRDFKDFCSNADNRLVNFWDECWEVKEKVSLRNLSGKK